MLQDNIHISDPQLFNFASNQAFTLSELVEAGKKYPYSLPIQAALARILKQSNPIDYEKFVKISAVLSPDRQWLYDFLQSSANSVKKPQNSEPIIDQPVISNQETKTSIVENNPLIISTGPDPVPFVETLPIPDPVKGPEEIVVIEIEEVALPETLMPLADDGNEIIVKALEEVEVAENVEPEMPEVEPVPLVQPEQKPAPAAQPENKPAEPLLTVKNDLLEREILKEAIDKSIQKEVSEIQVDSYRTDSVSPDKPEEQEKQQDSGFQYWLNPVRKKVESREQKLKKIDALIEKFIKSEPRIVPKKSEFFSPANAAKQSVVVNEDLVSEPLALIFEKQGYFDKAIKAYEKLSLKFPEKRAYFATRIEKIKEIVRNIKNNKE